MKPNLLHVYIRELLSEQSLQSQGQEGLEERFSAFMSEYESMSEANPIGRPDDRYWYMGEVDGKHCLVMTNLDVWDGAIHLAAIQTLPASVCEGKGYASSVMNKIVALADKHQVPMTLDPMPFGQARLGMKELVSWYKRAGFSPDYDRGGEWTRHPR
jgi:hypothetical protein